VTHDVREVRAGGQHCRCSCCLPDYNEEDAEEEEDSLEVLREERRGEEVRDECLEEGGRVCDGVCGAIAREQEGSRCCGVRVGVCCGVELEEVEGGECG